MITTSSTFEKVLNELKEQLHDYLVYDDNFKEVKVDNRYYWIEDYNESSKSVKVCVYSPNKYDTEYSNVEAYLSKALTEMTDFEAIENEAYELELEEEDWEETKRYLNETYR